MLPQQLLGNLRHVEGGHRLLLLAADLLHLMEPQLVVLDLLGSLLGGGVVDGIALGRAVLEGEAALGRWLHVGSCQDWRLLWRVF